jgi:CheY-like chemotaxis protein
LQLLHAPTAPNSLKQPCLIITDLNMPLMNGIEFLQALRRDPTLRRSVVFVLSSSTLDEDKSAAYEQGAAGYLLKSNLATHFCELVQFLACYQAIVEFPIT